MINTTPRELDKLQQRIVQLEYKQEDVEFHGKEWHRFEREIRALKRRLFMAEWSVYAEGK